VGCVALSAFFLRRQDLSQVNLNWTETAVAEPILVDFNITISDSLSPNTWKVYADSPATGDAEGKLELDLNDDYIQKLVAIVSGSDSNYDARKEFGELLFNKLFSHNVNQKWYQTRGRQDNELGSGIRLRLRIDDDKLAALPWELLRQDSVFLATSSDITLTRTLRVDAPYPLPQLQKLRILVITAAPKSLPIEKVESDIIISSIDKMGQATEIEALENPSLAEIQSALDKGVHIFHFLGHGSSGKIALADISGNLKAVTDRELSQLFQGRRTLRLAVFIACASAQGKDGAFSGMGPTLALQRIPSVVAMQYPFVKQNTAAVFCSAFYEKLSQGAAVDMAVNHARQLLSAETLSGNDRLLATRDWSTPVLWLNRRSNGIFDFADAPKLTTIARDQLSLHVQSTLGGIRNQLEQMGGQSELLKLSIKMLLAVGSLDAAFSGLRNSVENAQGNPISQYKSFEKFWSAQRPYVIEGLLAETASWEHTPENEWLEQVKKFIKNLDDVARREARALWLDHASSLLDVLSKAHARLREQVRGDMETFEAVSKKILLEITKIS